MRRLALWLFLLLLLSSLVCFADITFTVNASKTQSPAPAEIMTRFGHDITWQHEGSFLPMPSSIQQITMARQAGFGGVVVYSYAYCSKPDGENPSLMDQLRTGLFSEAATLPAMGWK